MNTKQNVKMVPGMALISAVVLVGAYAMNSIAQEPSGEVVQTSPESAESNVQVPVKCQNAQNNVCIDIVFDSDGCPKKAIPNGEDGNFYVKNSKRVVWQSVDDTPVQNPIAADYEIFFDPFKGQPHKSNGNGRISRLFDQNAPADVSGIEYKYSIVGLSDNCADAKKIHDPRFKVRR